MRRHIRVVGILMAIVGTLNTLLYLSLAGIYFFVGLSDPEKLRQWTGGNPAFGRGAQDKMSMMIAGGFALFWALGGALSILGGLSVYKVKSRTLGIAVAIVSLVPCLTAHPCCTYIPALGIGIYALVVLLNPDTVQAFEQVAMGVPADQALQTPPPV
jgi:hypothetical protein